MRFYFTSTRLPQWPSSDWCVDLCIGSAVDGKLIHIRHEWQIFVLNSILAIGAAISLALLPSISFFLPQIINHMCVWLRYVSWSIGLADIIPFPSTYIYLPAELVSGPVSLWTHRSASPSVAPKHLLHLRFYGFVINECDPDHYSRVCARLLFIRLWKQ